MNKKRTTFILFLLCLAALALNRFQQAQRQNPTGQSLKNSPAVSAAETLSTLNLPLDAEVSTMDPQAAVDSASFEIIAATLEGLYRMGSEDFPEPAIVLQEDILENETLYRFTLKEAVWSDGTPVQADDFVYAWKRGINPENGNENAFLFATAGIRNAQAILNREMDSDKLGVRALDAQTLEVELEKPCPYFHSLLTLPTFYPLNQEFYEQWGDQYGTSPQSLLSNGPFLVEEYQPSGLEIFLVKNPRYHQANEVSLEEIHYQVIKDSQQAVMAYQTGQLDMALLSGEQAEIYRDSPEYQSIPLSSLWYLSPNTQNHHLSNTALRNALTLAFDKELAARQVMKDGSRPAYGAVPWDFAYGPDGRDFREDAKELQESSAENNAKQPPKEQARQWMEQAKSELGTDSFTFTLLIEDGDTAKNLGQFLQEEIQQTLPEVIIHLEAVPKKARLERMGNGDYELGLARWGADYTDPLAFLAMWTSHSSFNYGKWSNKEYDQLIAAATGELLSFPEQRWQTLLNSEAILIGEAAIFPVCEKAYGILLRSNVKGAQFHGTGVNRVWSRCWRE